MDSWITMAHCWQGPPGDAKQFRLCAPNFQYHKLSGLKVLEMKNFHTCLFHIFKIDFFLESIFLAQGLAWFSLFQAVLLKDQQLEMHSFAKAAVFYFLAFLGVIFFFLGRYSGKAKTHLYIYPCVILLEYWGGYASIKKTKWLILKIIRFSHSSSSPWGYSHC